jgi:hypothetical protein
MHFRARVPKGGGRYAFRANESRGEARTNAATRLRFRLYQFLYGSDASLHQAGDVVLHRLIYGESAASVSLVRFSPASANVALPWISSAISRDDAHRPIGLILDYLHRSFDGCAGAIVAPLDHGSDAGLSNDSCARLGRLLPNKGSECVTHCRCVSESCSPVDDKRGVGRCPHH